VTNSAAYQLRENTGTTGLEQTARSAAELLAHFDIPHLIVGGLAVQEHGYPRLTTDVDIVVPDVLEAAEFLTSNLTGPFRRVPKVDDRLVDARNDVKIDLLPAGKVLRHGCQVLFPEPTEVSDLPKFITLQQLISLKLDSWKVTPLNRSQDKADVVQLIARRNLPRNFNVATPVQPLYHEIWDGLQAEGAQGRVHPV